MNAIKLLLVLILCLVASSADAGGLNRYHDLLVADAQPSAPLPRGNGVHITYLGTNAYLLESNDTTLLVDPYFSRMGLLPTALNFRPVSERELIQQYLRGHKIDAVLATHGHVDHLFDVPEVMRLTGAKLIASPTSVRLVESLGLPRNRCTAVSGGETVRVRGATVRVFAVQHDRLFGFVPFDGPARRLPPRKLSDWVCGEPLAFLIEMGGRRIYIESGGRPGNRDAQERVPPMRRVDLAILGVALPDARARFPQTLGVMHPRFVLPSHQDDFFRPLSRGFVFGPLTDFPAVLRAHRRAQSPSRLILLDYSRPWTLR